jgi:hypothetical protein
MAAVETRLKEEMAESEARYLQELDRVCALSSPRVAIERRLDHIARTRDWCISFGMISGDPCPISARGDGVEKYRLRRNDSNHVESDDMDFLCKDHGNFVAYEEYDPLKNYLDVDLYLLPDPESMTVDKLNDELRRRELSVSGEKAELAARLLSEAVNPVRKKTSRL